jgi:hypothetical protein
MKSDLFDFTAKIKHETAKAYLLDHGGKEPVWVPKSACEVELNADGKTVTVTMRQSLAEDKGIL